MDMITDRQFSYLSSLVAERDIPEDARQEFERKLASREITKRRASDFIERLKVKPKRADGDPTNPVGRIGVVYEEATLDDGKQHRVGYVKVGDARAPRGRYAIETADRQGFVNDTTFVKLWVGDRGGWKLTIQASDDDFHVTDWDKKKWIIEEIAKDPEAAMARYGHELGKCGMCGRTLTNDESRERGIGPICAGRL